MSDTTEKRGRGRPRRPGADGVILAVASDLLRETGLEAFSVDTVAARSGIAKTTIYRRWPGKASLVADVLDAAVPRNARTVSDALREIGDAMRILGAAGVAGAEVMVPFITSRLEALAGLIETEESEVISHALAGALLLRFLSHSGPIDEAFIEKVRGLLRGA